MEIDLTISILKRDIIKRKKGKKTEKNEVKVYLSI
jgi:hypothetical protein